MLFKFFGAAQEVGRSAIYMKDVKGVLFDYGIKLGTEKPEYPIGMPDMDAFVLSHAHIDHCGAAPTIYNELYVPTFGTRPTLKLSNILLEDSLSVARKNHTQAKFHKRQIKTFTNKFMSKDYHKPFRIGDMELEFFDAGHIAGSAVTLINRKNAKENRRVVYTGDFKLEPQSLHKGAEIVESDVLVMESTYAKRKHPDRKELVNRFITAIKETIDNGGNALVPVFAVGRSQEILYLLHKHNLSGYTYIDGMARAATKAVLNYPDYIQNHKHLEDALDQAQVISDSAHRKEALESPSVILTTAGMLSGGPVLNYITKLNKYSQIMLTGYQVDGSNGRTLLDHKKVVIDGVTHKIETPASYFDFSAHAGRDDLYEYVKKSNPSTVICVHGDEENAKDLAENLAMEGYKTHAPKLGETIKLE
ncbi:MAG: MBL fold metallo-hydrolase [Candidatus Micrarchaeota archaeon]|nr:MBL fold metallo-hydrolase [Candidatus Micrarchaeota archaeon]